MKKMSVCYKKIDETTDNLGKISVPKHGKDEAEQCTLRWWTPHGHQRRPRTRFSFVSALQDDLILRKTLKRSNECV